MAFRSVVSSRIPMVIVVGSTGSGKTKLGVQLAQKFGGEIISADSMQIYKGLDLVTAKASLQEREAAPHHLLDILEPHQMFTVVDFRNRALKIIDSLMEQGKMPIVVGGTNYYIESIVYKILVEDHDDTEALLWDKSKRKRDFNNTDPVNNPINKKPNKEASEDDKEEPKAGTSDEKAVKESVTDVCDKVDKVKIQEDVDNEKYFTNEEIHQKLKDFDPVMAARLHPNNRRKVLRSIEVWLKTGRRHSEILAEQKVSEGQLRRPGATLIFWLKCDQDILDKRLDARVDAMLENGLIQELLDFHEKHNKQRIQDGEQPDYTKGVFQTLGFKEFHEYLMLSEEERNSEDGKKLLQKSIENMKIATRRYARRQKKMVRGRFLEHPNREIPPIYELDTSDVSRWDENVTNVANQIIENYLHDKPCDYKPIKSELDENKKSIDGNSRNFCPVCERLIIGDETYRVHLKSLRHSKIEKKQKKANEHRMTLQDSKISVTE